jgi:WD40 repeat protein
VFFQALNVREHFKKEGLTIMQTITWTSNNRILFSTGTTCEVMTPASNAARYFPTEGLSILSPDGTLVAIDEINAVRVRAVIENSGQWKVGAVMFACQGLEASPVLGYAWSPDGKTLAIQQQKSTSTYQIQGRVRRQGQRKGVYRPSQSSATPRPMVFAPNGTRVAEAVHSGVALWDAATGKLIRMIGQGHVSSVAWDAAGNYLALGKSEGNVAIYSMRKATLLTDQVAHSTAVSALAWSPDGNRLISGDLTGQMKVWQIGDEEWSLSFVKDLEALSARIDAFAWSPDERQIAVVGATNMDIFTL